MSQKAKKKQESITTDDDYYSKYILDSGGGDVIINITIKGDKNNVRVFSGQPPPNPKPPGH